ncbi:MAG: hypothetical protein JRN10_00825 [Nitrososphaerota archaeon]|jgi:hypothetical protein|nr:hypothetical protein [Nitrososphaerota archaeon]MDG6929780.1 hypothetical protein [Nitrososphaerota archaeon]
MNLDYAKYTPYILFLAVLALGYAFVTGRLTLLLHHYIVPTGVGLAAFFVFITWMYGNIKPGWPGDVVGSRVFYGFYGGHYFRFDGLFVDITAKMINETNLGRLKELILADLQSQLNIEKEPLKKEDLRRTISSVETMDAQYFTSKIKVYGTRRDFTRYIWVWLADKPLDEYEFASTFTSFSFPYGPIGRGGIFGIQVRLPQSVKVIGYGKVKVRVFIPLLDKQKTEAAAKMYDETFIRNVALLGSQILTASMKAFKLKEYETRMKILEKADEEKAKKIAELQIKKSRADYAATSTNLFQPPGEEKKALNISAKSNPIALLLASVFGTLIFGNLLPKYVHGLGPVSASMIGALAFGVIYLLFSNR